MAIDKQITFDAIVNGLRKQGKKSLNTLGLCVFRAEDGSRCAVGQLIEEKEYVPGFDDYKTSDNAFEFVVNKGHNKELLHDLMTCHDSKLVENWESEFKTVAENHGLIYTPKV